MLPLDTIVINTEAHIFPRFELQKNLRTGWTRKPRDKYGHIILKETDSITQESKTKDLKDEDVQRIKEAVEEKLKSKGGQHLLEESNDVQESSKKGSKDASEVNKGKGGKTQMTTVTRSVTSTVLVDVEKATYPASAQNPKAADLGSRKKGKAQRQKDP